MQTPANRVRVHSKKSKKDYFKSQKSKVNQIHVSLNENGEVCVCVRVCVKRAANVGGRADVLGPAKREGSVCVFFRSPSPPFSSSDANPCLVCLFVVRS